MLLRTTLTALLALLAGAPALFASVPFEIGANDFRISQIGPDGDERYQASAPAVAYSALHHEYLVAWLGRFPEQGTPRREIFVQRLDAATGAERGVDDLRISDAAALGGTANGGLAVAYNPDRDEYLVVFQAVVGDESHLYAQRLDGATGEEVGIDDLWLTPSVEGEKAYPALIYNPVEQEYLLAWANEGALGQAEDEWEIYVSQLDGATGAAGAIQPISSMGGIGDPSHRAEDPAVAFSPDHNQYLVVWADRDLQAEGLTEIYGQLLDADLGVEIGIDDVQISQTGDPSRESVEPAVAYAPGTQTFLVVFVSNRTGIEEVYGREVLPTSGSPIDSDFRLSWEEKASRPALAYVPEEELFLVAWLARDPAQPAGQNEIELFGRLVEHDGEWLSPPLRLSDVAGTGTGDILHYPQRPALTGAEGHGELLAVWAANDIDHGLGDFEFEVFGQRVGAALFADGFESGGVGAWSESTIP